MPESCSDLGAEGHGEDLREALEWAAGLAEAHACDARSACRRDIERWPDNAPLHRANAAALRVKEYRAAALATLDARALLKEGER